MFAAYDYSFSGGSGIYTVNANGAELTRLTGDNHDFHPSWSPNGTQIAFSSQRGGLDRDEIFVMNADGSDVVQRTHLTFRSSIRALDWSPDGSAIAFFADDDLWLVNADGTNERLLLALSENAGLRVSTLVWSPDGGRITLAGQIGVAMVNIADPTLRIVSSRSTANVAWSPDGARLMYRGGGGLVTALPDGSDEQSILRTEETKKFVDDDGLVAVSASVPPDTRGQAAGRTRTPIGDALR